LIERRPVLGIKFKNFTNFTILFDAEEDFTLCISYFPTGPLLVKISRAIDIYIFRTIQNDPAGIFPVPEI